MPSTIDLPEGHKSHLGITKIINSFQGGQKDVYICETSKYGLVAVKLLKNSFNEREMREANFYKDHKHLLGIPKLVDIIIYERDTMLIEEYIDGVVLSQDYNHYFNNDDAIIKLITNICRIMSPIWEKGYVHRDLKPDNILIDKDKNIFVIDFGIYKNPDNSTITDTFFQPNSALFAAPEQLIPNKSAISYRTDFFSLGVIAYFLKYNKYPFGNTKDQIISNFSSDKLNCEYGNDCRVKIFCEKVFQLDVSKRPRNPEMLLKEF